ncbi:MAG: PhzF family phenazine biosynthesis protein [Moritella sp.]|uniref:PhzF family phenazine biosynthesis protein n=1 Tax=unclassified Moritella TaxID=2637987 RepID=UPI0001568952|nr:MULTISPECIES: PhzF family phenazine biosynthesis protein [unclassified Moritella]EDM68475.1 phenazine biosynthesis protein, PhzF family [Moritella sp. PE36]MBL1416338.1 PhzF family phenazine biosynthesis protein [Moritella sp.]PHR88909.1 MAG: PhzF family phenazine biosynthesis protein [Moritella sp.]
MDIEVLLVNSFTANGKGGNPAGVVLNADKLSDTQKLKIAQAVGYSETAFVSNDDEVDFEVSFFTTTNEVDFCGHATLATFSIMYQMNLLTAGDYVQRTKAGILPVVIDSDGQVTMDLQLPETLGGFSYQEIAPVLGIDSAILASTNLPIEVVSTGLADLIIPVPIGQLDLINPNDLAITDFCKKHDIVGFHVFERCAPGSLFTASCRNFAPLFGIPEESATGSASGALACYLAEHLPLDNKYIFEQGRAMNCASVITVSVGFQDAKIASVKVGGVANQIGSMFVPI